MYADEQRVFTIGHFVLRNNPTFGSIQFALPYCSQMNNQVFTIGQITFLKNLNNYLTTF